jgi:formylglycine-generating enzyme
MGRSRTSSKLNLLNFQKKYSSPLWLGLALDLLHFFTTDLRTAASYHPDFVHSHYSHQSEYKQIIQILVNSYLLIEDQKDKFKPFIRLAHDALGPVVLNKHDKRAYPSQQAYFITRSKSSGFSEQDTDLALTTQPYIRKLDADLWKAIKKDRDQHEESRIKVRQDKAFIFGRLQNEFESQMIKMDFSAGLESFKAAFRHDPTEAANLVLPLDETLFFAAATRNMDLAHQTLEALREVHPQQSKIISALDVCTTNASKFSSYLADFFFEDEYYEDLNHRFYPKMVGIAGGEYTMGASKYDDDVAHEVAVNAFKMATTPVTVRQWALFCTNNPSYELRQHASYWGLDANHPVVNMSWYNAIEYLNWLSTTLGRSPAYEIDKSKKDGNNLNQQDASKWIVQRIVGSNGFRLPQEEEWEFAAKGGKIGLKDNFQFSGGDDLLKLGWYKDNSFAQTQKVMNLDPNQLGLYDMSGNVWEWCFDWYENYIINNNNKLKTHETPHKGQTRVLRGGSWFNNQFNCHVAARLRNDPFSRYYSVGFRVAQD